MSAMTRNDGIDMLKGVAILSVIIQHSTGKPPYLWAELWLEPAVPVFIILLAYNWLQSWKRLETRPHAVREFYKRRFAGVAFAFLFVYALSIILTQISGNSYNGWLRVLAGFPSFGPGNYFVMVVVTMILIFPFIARAWTRRPRATVLALVGIDVGFQLFMATRDIEKRWDLIYVYDTVPLRYFGAVAAGLILSTAMPSLSAWLRKHWLIVTGAAAASFAYLAAYHVNDQWFTFIQTYGFNFETQTNVLSIPAAFAITTVSLALIERFQIRFPPLVALGRASWQIFLIQVIFYWELTLGIPKPVVIASSLLVCCPAGVLLLWLEQAIRRAWRERGTQAAMPA